MPTASQGRNAGWWPTYAPRTDPNVRPRATSQKAAEDRRPFSEQAARRPQKAAVLPRPQISQKISWEENLKVLKRYVAREGHALVPLEHEEDGVRLGMWLSKQWSEWQSDTRGGYLSRNRKLRLEEAGVVFNGPAPPASGAVGAHTLNERKWDTGRNFDMASKKRHPTAWDTSTPASANGHWQPYSSEADPALGKWLARQRELRLAPPPPPPPEPYIPLAIVPPVKGLPMGLAKKLAKARDELAQQKEIKRDGSTPGSAKRVQRYRMVGDDVLML